MTHAELVRTTAEKMARLKYPLFDLLPKELINTTIHEYKDIAELAVAMKAEGFDEGWDGAVGYITIPNEPNYKQCKQQLGLTKPTEND